MILELVFVLLVPGNKKRKETMEKLKKGKELYIWQHIKTQNIK